MFLKKISKSFIGVKIKVFLYTIVYEIYDLVTWLVTLYSRPKRNTKNLLIIRVDEIGDYMLWRNFLREIVEAKRFENYKIHLCGNSNWKSIFEAFDYNSVSYSHWMNKEKFRNNLLYRFSFLKEIYNQNYDLVINTTFSRDRINDETVVKASCAKINIGMFGNVIKDKEDYKIGHYTHFFTPTKKIMFEFDRNKEFTAFLIGDKPKSVNINVPFDKLPILPQELSSNYFVVFPGTRNPERIWATQNFIEVSDFLYEKTGYTAVVCGTKNDNLYTTAFCLEYKYPFIDLTSKTSLVDMLSILKEAKCLLSADTGAVHLAAAVSCPVFGVFNGSYYGRFAPYPREIASNFFAIYPDEIDADYFELEIVMNKYKFKSDLPYSSITANKMINVISKSDVFNL